MAKEEERAKTRMLRVSLAKAKSHFVELIARAAAGEPIEIRRNDRPVAVLISAGEFNRFKKLSREAGLSAIALGQRPELVEKIQANKLHPAMAAFGLWRKESEFDDLTERIYSNRSEQGSRPTVQLSRFWISSTSPLLH